MTIDDLPWQRDDVPDRLEATERILRALEDEGAPATGFVICSHIRPGEPILEKWLEAGMDLGNHTDAHLDLNKADLASWLDDVSRCNVTLEKITGKPVHWFRYPMLHQGPDAARRDAAAARVRELGLTVAHVSIDNVEWRLAAWYGEAAKQGNAARKAAIASAYREHIVAAARHYQEEARRRTGRDVAHVLLLHANALAADHLAEALADLKRAGFRFVTLEEALADPVYRLPDRYLGPWGISFLERLDPPTKNSEWIDEQDAMLAKRLAPSGS